MDLIADELFQSAAGRRVHRRPLLWRPSPSEAVRAKWRRMPRAADDVRQAMKSSHSAEQRMLRGGVLALIAAGGRRSVAGNVGPGTAFHFALALHRNGDPP